MPATSFLRKGLSFVLILLILLDLGYSFLAFLGTPLGGDLAGILVPLESHIPILKDPVGWNVLMTGEPQLGPNRFFAYWFTHHYMRSMPLFLQYFTDPVNSPYLAAAIIKSITQIGLIGWLSKCIIGKKSIFSFHFLLAFALLLPLVQTGFACQTLPPYETMSVVDQSIVYVFAYGFSFLFPLLYLFPFVQMIRGHRTASLKWWESVLLISLSFPVIFNGPANTPAMLILALLTPLTFFIKNWHSNPSPNKFKQTIQCLKSIPITVIFHFGWIFLLGIYSFYIGNFNIENPENIPSLAERYFLWNKGLHYHFYWTKQGTIAPLLLILLFICSNLIILRITKSKELSLFMQEVCFIAIFVLIYLLILPLGGYRVYRPIIIRADIILPCLLSIFYLFGKSSYLLLFHLSKRQQYFYLTLVIGVALFFSFVDQNDLHNNACERKALHKIATEKAPVEIPYCTVISWEVPKKPEDAFYESKVIQMWGITEEQKEYYSPKK